MNRKSRGARWWIFALFALWIASGCAFEPLPAEIDEPAGLPSAVVLQPVATATPLRIEAATAAPATAAGVAEATPTPAAATTVVVTPSISATVPVTAPSPAPLIATPVVTPTATSVPLTAAVITHTVQAGETTFIIATRYASTVEAIALANDLADPSMIYAGQALLVPVGVADGAPLPGDIATPVAPLEIIGYSAGGRPIEAYTLGDGPAHIAVVGAIHGGYEWNTAILAYDMLEALAADPDQIPPEITLHIIPIANPDGIAKVVGWVWPFGASSVPADIDATAVGRTNGNDVDLNRNWDCNWAPSAEWRYGPISPGAGPFSEPETVALRDYLEGRYGDVLKAAIFLHSAAGIVSPGICGEPDAAAEALSTTYATATGIYAMAYFTAYPITGDASDYLVARGIPSFTVELTTHDAIELAPNLRGLVAVMDAVAVAAPEVEP